MLVWSVAVSDKRSPLLEDLLDGLELEISVGIHEDEGGRKEGEQTNAELGARHEFGLGVPQRSFIRHYIDENESLLYERSEAALAKVLTGADAEVEAGKLGAQMVGEIKTRMLAGLGDPSRDLVDTSQMIGSIRSKVT